MENPVQGNSTVDNGTSDNNDAGTKTESLMNVIDNSVSDDGTPDVKPVDNGEKAEGNNTSKDNNAQLPAWTQQLPEDMRNNAEVMAQLGKFQKIGDMAKSYSELESKLGKSLIQPGTDASAEEKQAFYEKLGKPSNVDGYSIKDENAKAFKELAFNNNLTDEQAVSVFSALQNIGKAEIEKNRESLERQAAETEKNLKQKYGSDYNKKMEMLKRGIQTYGGKELYDQLKQSGLITKQNIVEMYVLLGEQSSEAGSYTGSASRAEGYKDTMQGGHFNFKYD